MNKYHEWDLEMTFDTFDPGNDLRHEMKELYFIKANWVDLEGNTVEYASPIDPEDLEPYDHEPGQPGGEGGAGGPPAGSSFVFLSDPLRLEEVTIDMTSSPQVMQLRLICNVSEYDEAFTLYRHDTGAFVDDAGTLGITLTDPPGGDDTKLERITTFVITPLFGYMRSMELYETGTDTNVFRSRYMGMVVDMTQFEAQNEIGVTLTNNLFAGLPVSETHYNALGQVDYVRDAAGNTTLFGYDPATGRRTSETNPAGTVTRFAYDDQDRVVRTWGDVPYPVEYVYDIHGRMVEMRTFRAGSEWNGETWPDTSGLTADVTRWHYDDASGLLAAKEDAAGYRTVYSYLAGGKLGTRTWAREAGSIVTTYSFDPATGELLNVDYADSTPDIAYTYNRLGQTATVTDAVGSRSFTYNGSRQLDHETITGLYDETITMSYTASGEKGRPSGFSLTNSHAVQYGYDSLGRFRNLSWSGHAATYDYHASSDLLAKLTVNGPGSAVTATYGYEPKRNLRTQVRNRHGSETISQYDYVYNELGMRTSVMNSGTAFTAVESAFNLYGYNGRNELIESNRYLGDALDNSTQPVPDEYRSYDFDPIGNRIEAVTGTAAATAYQTNNLNQYTQVTGPDPTQELFHDEDGNLTSLVKGTTTTLYAWNAENRLIAVQPQTPTDGATKTEFTYDYMGRRVHKAVSTYTSGSWTETSSTLFLYDGWNLIKETTTENNTTTTRHFIWGLDLSQTTQGAGGIGGLIATFTDSATFLHTYDANGNTAQLIHPTTNTIAAHYEYDPFGNTLLATGPEASCNPFRFSTKYHDDETGLVYYGYRYYMPELGRWVNRDPIGEIGGLNLYVFSKNNSINFKDILGKTSDDEELIEVCIRRANVPLGKFAASIGIYHMWIKTSYIEVGLGPQNQNVPGGFSPDNPFAETSVNIHDGESRMEGTKCFEIVVNTCCIKNELNLGSTGKSCAEENCNEWVERVIIKCDGDWKKFLLEKAKWEAEYRKLNRAPIEKITENSNMSIPELLFQN